MPHEWGGAETLAKTDNSNAGCEGLHSTWQTLALANPPPKSFDVGASPFHTKGLRGYASVSV